MYNDSYVDRLVGQKLIERDAEESAKHISSGKLSASQLGSPLQWQILKTLGIGQRKVDEYTLRKFFRGKEIEKWLLSEMDGVIEQQKSIEYRGMVGFVDAMVDTKNYDFKFGVIPHEVKSVTNLKFKRIVSQKSADNGHILQAASYALATGSEHFAIDYVASDDLRILTFVYPVTGVKPVINAVIDRYQAQLKLKQVPIFIANEKWQSDIKYNNYPEWTDLTQDQIDLAIKIHYPKVWEKVK